MQMFFPTVADTVGGLSKRLFWLPSPFYFPCYKDRDFFAQPPRNGHINWSEPIWSRSRKPKEGRLGSWNKPGSWWSCWAAIFAWDHLPLGLLLSKLWMFKHPNDLHRCISQIFYSLQQTSAFQLTYSFWHTSLIVFVHLKWLIVF